MAVKKKTRNFYRKEHLEYVTDRDESTKFFTLRLEWTSTHAGGIQRKKSNPVFLPKGQHAGLYHAGMWICRTLSTVSGKRRSHTWREQGQCGVTQEI